MSRTCPPVQHQEFKTAGPQVTRPSCTWLECHVSSGSRCKNAEDPLKVFVNTRLKWPSVTLKAHNWVFFFNNLLSVTWGGGFYLLTSFLFFTVCSLQQTSSFNIQILHTRTRLSRLLMNRALRLYSWPVSQPLVCFCPCQKKKNLLRHAAGCIYQGGESRVLISAIRELFICCLALKNLSYLIAVELLQVEISDLLSARRHFCICNAVRFE